MEKDLQDGLQSKKDYVPRNATWEAESDWDFLQTKVRPHSWSASGVPSGAPTDALRVSAGLLRGQQRDGLGQQHPDVLLLGELPHRNAQVQRAGELAAMAPPPTRGSTPHHPRPRPSPPSCLQGCFPALKAKYEDKLLILGISVIALCIVEVTRRPSGSEVGVRGSDVPASPPQVLAMCFAMTLFCHIRSGLGYKL